MDDDSDAGGVAARIGFKYQDHIAAGFALDMIGDRRVTQIECETSDDIVIRAIRGGSANQTLARQADKHVEIGEQALTGFV